MGEKSTKITKFVLPEAKVTVKFIKRRVGIAADVSEDHVISGGMLEGATKKLYAPMTRNGGIKNVLTNEEKEFFENNIYTGRNLSSYGNFWKEFFVELEKSGLTLDLAQPTDYLRYKLLLSWSDLVAPSLKEYRDHNRPSYQFYMERDGEDARIRSKELAIKKKAWKNFNRIEDDRETLGAVIFLLTGKRMADNAKLETLNDLVSDQVEKKPEEFNQLIEDTHFDTKVFVARAEKAGIIKKTKTGYETMDGLPVTEKGKANTVDNVVKFLLDPVNNEVKELIISRLDNIEE